MFRPWIVAALLLSPVAAVADDRSPAQPSDLPSFKILARVQEALSHGRSLPGGDRLRKSLAGAATEAGELPPERRNGVVERHLPEINAAADELGAQAAPAAAWRINDAMAQLNNSAGHFQDSLRYSDRALAHDPDNRDALISRSAANAGLNRYEAAFADADRAAKLSPGGAAPLRARAMAAYGLKNYMRAVEDARRAVAIDPNDQVSFYVMRLAESKVPPLKLDRVQSQMAGEVQREYHGMIQQFNQAAEPRPEPAPSAAPVRDLVRSASTKITLRDYFGAISDADRALEKDPANVSAYYYRAAAKNLAGRYDEAAQDATHALRLDPGDVRSRDARAWAYNSLGRFRDAMSDATHSLEISPDNPYAYWNLAYAREHVGDLTGMLRDLRAAAGLSPQFEPAYRDAAVRHGLEPEPLASDKLLPAEQPRFSRDDARRRSFTVVLVSSVVGGILIALGFIHLYGQVKTPASKDPAPRLPRLGAGYVLGQALGRGGMGLVYEAFDKALERKVAVKVMRHEAGVEPQSRRRFLQEARTVAALHHPAIVDIHSIVEDGPELCLIFEHIEGRTLEDILSERRRLSLQEARSLLKPVCQALDYAHRHGVVHRDLKPGNIMVTEAGQVKIMDFGISRQARRDPDPLTSAERATARGTPYYMAPEQERGDVRRESDVFSLGACLYEMVTGLRPFPNAYSLNEKVTLDYARPTTIVPALPADLDGFMDRALDPDPDKRISTAADFLARLDRLSAPSSAAA